MVKCIHHKFVIPILFLIFGIAGELTCQGDNPQSEERSSTASLARFDYPLSTAIHSILDASEGTDKSLIRDLIAQMSKSDPSLDPRASFEIDLLAWLLRQATQAALGVNSERDIEGIWNREPAEDWSWNGLLALTDILDRLRLEKSTTRVAIFEELKKRVLSCTDAYQDGIISQRELSERSCSYANRIVSPMETLAYCRSMQSLLPKDFPLATLCVSKFQLLSEAEKKTEADGQRIAIDHCLAILDTDDELAKLHPLAAPKLLFERAETETEISAKVSLLEEAAKKCDGAYERLEGLDSKSLQRESKRLRICQQDLASYRWHQLRIAISTNLFLLQSQNPGDRANAAWQLACRCKALAEHHRKLKFATKDLYPTISTLLKAIQACKAVDAQAWESLLNFAKSQVPDEKNQSSEVQKQIEEIQLAWSEIQLSQRDKLSRESSKTVLNKIFSTSNEAKNVARGIVDLGMLYIGEGCYENAKGIHAYRPTYEANLIAALAEMKLGHYVDAKKRINKDEKTTFDSAAKVEEESIHTQLMTKLIQCELHLQSGCENDMKVARSLAMALAEQIKGADPANSESDTEVLKRIGTENQNHLAMIYWLSEPRNEKKVEWARDIWESQRKDESSKFIALRAAYFLALMARAEMTERNPKDAWRQALAKYESKSKAFESQGGTDSQEYTTLKADHEQLKTIPQSTITAPSAMDRVQLQAEIANVREIIDNLQELDDDHPNLQYNLYCLLLQLHGFALPGSDEDQRLVVAECRKACFIGIRLRGLQNTSLELKDILLAKYRVAFDHSVPLLAKLGKHQDAIELASWTTNQAITDLSKKSPSNDLGKVQMCNSKDAIEQVSINRDAIGDMSIPALPKRLLAYYVGQNAIEIFWRLKGEEIQHDSFAIERKDLDRQIKALIDDLEQKRSTADRRLGLGLSRALLPLRMLEDLKNCSPEKCLFILPHGPLFQIAFESLPLLQEYEGEERNEDASMEILFDLLPPTIYLQTLGSSNSSDRFEGEESRVSIQTSDSAGYEGRMLVKNGWNEIRRATKEDLMIELTLKNPHSIIHIGAHGKVESADSQAASFEVWKEETLSMVALRDAMNGTLLRTNLVFLSACESQQVNVKSIQFGGNTHKAIGTTFLILGARNVIATYWRVEAPSVEPIALETLLTLPATSTGNLTQAEIARQLYLAKKKIRNETKEDLSHPYHWAAFCLTSLYAETD